MAMSEEQGLVEELLALRGGYCNMINAFPSSEMDTIFSASSWDLDNLTDVDQFHWPPATGDSTFFQDGDPYSLQQHHDPINYYNFNDLLMYSQYFGADAMALTDSSTTSFDSHPNFSVSEPAAFVAEECFHDHKVEVEVEVEARAEPAGRVVEQSVLCAEPSGLDRRVRGKRMEGQPSKNLMAERRRRKRLNDRLSMLRSIVPKISKMDRTAILGDTIDYMKELVEKIKELKEHMEVSGTTDSKSSEMGAHTIFKGVRPNEVLLRNSPKFEVERRDMDTKVEICCSGKPGLVLSTVATLEALGLEIQQCVISCFSDFNMQASCSSEESDQQGTFMSCEDIKDALFRNAGYGGRCL